MRLIRVAFIIALALAPPVLTAQNCMGVLFHDTTTWKNHCIVDYNKHNTLGNISFPGCTGQAVGLPTSSGYVVIGPLAWASRISFDYYWVPGTGQYPQVDYSTDYNPTTQTGTWTLVEQFAPVDATCTSYITPTQCPANSYYRVSLGGGNTGGGPIRCYVRDLQPADPVPVELTSFTACRVGSNVHLTWRTTTEKNNFGFDVERNTGDEWQRIGFVAGNGTSNVPQSYEFTDAPHVSSGEVRYRLRQTDRDGSVEYSPVVSVSFGAVRNSCLLTAYPNPFNPSTTLSFSIARDSRITLRIYNETGQVVTTLIAGEQLPAGSYSSVFQAATLPSGNYIAWLFSDNESSLLQLNVVK